MKGPRFFAYLAAELKRYAAFLPAALLTGALLLGAAALLGFSAAADRRDDAAARKLNIGVVGDIQGDEWLRLGFYALENLDVSRDSLRFVYVDEAEAARGLRAGSLDAYAVIPEGFAAALAAGTELTPIRYVSTEGAVGVGTLLSEELVRSIARLLLETENAIYGAQRYAAERLPESDPYAVGDRLAEAYLTAILSRDELFRTETVGVSGGLSLSEYYLRALTVLLLLMWGVACAPLAARRSPALQRALGAAGLGPGRQVLAEYLAYMALMLLCLALLFGVCRAGLTLLPGLGVDPSALSAVVPEAAFPALTLGAGQLFLFELAPHPAGGTLVQFLSAMALGYLSGCFYPESFFPDALRRFGAALPSGAALRFLSGGGGAALLLLALYLAAFLGLAALCRRRAWERGGT